MAKRHARSRSPYKAYNANNYSPGNVYQPYTTPFYYQPPPAAPLPIYSPTLPPPFPPMPYNAPYMHPLTPIPGSQPVFGNRAPLPDEMVALQNTLQMKEATVAFLDAQIEAARENLELLAVPYLELRARFESAQAAYFAAKENHEDLIQQRNTLDRSMDHLSSLLNPLRRFSDDVLAHIFMCAVDAEIERDYERLEPPRSRRQQVIVNIVRVCSKWRRVARDKPELWTYVRLNLSRRLRVHEKLQHFLDLARGLPMNIYTSHLQPNFFGASSDSEDDENGSSSSTLLAPVKQMRSFTVNFTHYRALHCLPMLGTQNLDTLEELHLRSEPMSSPASGLFSITSYLSEAPKLRVLRLIHVHLLPPAAHEVTPHIILPRLEELVLHGPVTHGTDIFGFSQLITMIPNVQKINYIQNDTIQFTHQDDVQLLKLRELVTNCCALENSLRSSFGADKVQAPKLEKLTVNDAVNLMTGLAHFLQSVQSIRILSIMGNFDPLSDASVPAGGGFAPTLFQPPGGGLLPQVLQPVLPIPPPPVFVQPPGFVPAPNPVTGPTEPRALLKAMKDIEELEIISIHPRFAEALCDIATVDPSDEETPEPKTDGDEKESRDKEMETATERPLSDPPTSSKQRVQTWRYLARLRKLEFTVNKSFPMSVQEFESIFEARCWTDKPPANNADVGSEMRPLDKLEVHLGAGLNDALTEAVSRRMKLDGEDRGSRWFSWTREI
ncbi:SubName: Full=Uncharacterized protein {ECO:0000313/EMBL:CCA66468.1} [Serendipita indica DSM 11827]|nr:SubName: Full=Uncharacterized protein {ECO:0000313/EMBL:CCA66468.1} [Serendipita indica DSM 11827]